MNDRPEVAILLDRFGPGGVVRVACHVANGLHRSGIRVEMVVLDDTGPVRSLLDGAIPVRRIQAPEITRRRRRMVAAIPAIAHYLRERRPRILHSPGNHTNRPAAFAARLAGFDGAFVPKITNPLLNDRMTGRRRWIRRLLYRWALSQAHKILVLSKASIGDIADIDARLVAKARVVHNPYVTQRMLLRATHRAPSEPPVILSMGRLSKQKNHGMLLRAAARLRDRPWRLRICGTGPKEAALRILARELGIEDRLELPGFVQDPTDQYAKATVLAVSSRWEGLPAIVLEAIACGCPVVCTRSSAGLVELLNNVGAREPVAIDDEEAFAAALSEALDGKLPRVPPTESLPYSIESSMAEHAELFGEILGRSVSLDDESWFPQFGKAPSSAAVAATDGKRVAS
jgi:glycosyltransferase involved in cell wall biosynthesis